MLGKGSRIPSRGRSWWLTLGLLVLCAGSATAAGFHDSGVAACSYCHTMHGTRDGMPLPFGSPGGHALLVDTPPSDLCLNCHALSLGAVLADDPLMPTPERGPGNFVFLKSINLNDGTDGLTDPIPGDRAGHNVRAPGHGLYSDATNIHAPGGTFPSRNLKCTSCHDPHGNQNYRMLRGVGQGAQGVFQYPAPLAEGLPFGSGQSESEGNHVAYQSGMSRWCGNCHPDLSAQRPWPAEQLRPSHRREHVRRRGAAIHPLQRHRRPHGRPGGHVLSGGGSLRGCLFHSGGHGGSQRGQQGHVPQLSPRSCLVGSSCRPLGFQRGCSGAGWGDFRFLPAAQSLSGSRPGSPLLQMPPVGRKPDHFSGAFGFQSLTMVAR